MTFSFGDIKKKKNNLLEYFFLYNERGGRREGDTKGHNEHAKENFETKGKNVDDIFILIPERSGYFHKNGDRGCEMY